MNPVEKATAKGLEARAWAEGDPDEARHMLGLREDTPDEIVVMVAEEEAAAVTLERESIYAYERVRFHRDQFDDPEKLSAQVDRGIGQKENGAIGSILTMFKSTADLAADPVPATSSYISKIIPKGAFIQVAGSAKSSGKTTFVLHGCSAILNRRLFLGESTEYTPIVFLTEQGRSGFEAEYLEPIGLMGRLDLHILNGFETRGRDYEDIVAAAVEKCRREGAGVLVLDTFLYWARVHDENNSAEMQKALRSLQDAAASGLSVLLLHHARKGGGDTVEAGRGSSAFAGAVDLIHNLRRPQGQGSNAVRELRSEGRYGGLYDSLMIELVDGQYVAHGSRADVAQQKADEAVKGALPKSEGDALTTAELLEAVKPEGVGRSACQRARDKLVDTGQARKIGKGKKGEPYRYFLLPDMPMNGNGHATNETDEASEMLSAQNNIPIGRKENGVNGQKHFWARDDEGQE